MKKIVVISAYFPVDLALNLRILAAKINVSRSEILRRAAKEYLIKNMLDLPSKNKYQISEKTGSRYENS
ncbi:CopG family transcriptional regulator [Chloroflexota bacterium]